MYITAFAEDLFCRVYSLNSFLFSIRANGSVYSVSVGFKCFVCEHAVGIWEIIIAHSLPFQWDKD